MGTTVPRLISYTKHSWVRREFLSSSKTEAHKTSLCPCHIPSLTRHSLPLHRKLMWHYGMDFLCHGVNMPHSTLHKQGLGDTTQTKLNMYQRIISNNKLLLNIFLLRLNLETMFTDRYYCESIASSLFSCRNVQVDFRCIGNEFIF